jgi:hypothetical protein
MKNMQFKITIHATTECVWNVLWQDETFQDWASIIDPGTYKIGELKQGNELQFISSNNGYGVTSLIEKLITNELLQLRHSADTQNSGKNKRTNEWTGAKETYSLVEENGVTTLRVAFDVPPEQEAYFKLTFPKALQRVKELAENNN